MLKLLFIDRDGVINRDPGGWTKHSYVTEPEDLHFLPGALKALRLLNSNRIRVVVISNQAGISKGLFTKEQLAQVSSKLLSEVKKAGGKIEDVCYCTHRNEDNCDCRKPKPGMLERAMKKYRISPKDTFFIGDSWVDIEAGLSVGIRTIFVLSGKHSKEEMKKWKVRPNYIFNNLLEAVEWIISKEKRRAERAVERAKRSKHKDVPKEFPLEEEAGEEGVG